MILFILTQNESDLIIIDQPEDDLDNQVIYEELVKTIRLEKANMQFIFATHNPNIPVLGDAEKIVRVDYNADEEKIELQQGNIDDGKTHDSRRKNENFGRAERRIIMAQAQKARKLEIELPAMNAESMDKAVQDIYIRKYIRYKEGAIRYSVSIHTFQDMAREAGAVIKCKGISLVDTTIFEEYLDSFRIENN